MHEILTVQLGQRANYLATHFWNAQESYHTFPPTSPSPINHDIHFRQGIAPDGSETYLPRALIYDLRGGFGSLARVNALGADVDEKGEAAAWSGRLTRLQITSTTPSPYAQSLVASETPTLPTPETTAFFSDFASTYYHPRSLIPITPPYPSLEDPNSPPPSALPSFNTFWDGASLFSSLDSAHDMLDRDVRLWAEECDAMQGIQVMTGADDAWAGFAAAYVERLRDEFGKGSVWVWGIEGAAQGGQTMTKTAIRSRTLNHALALASFASQASLYIPLSVPSRLHPSVRLDSHVLWHSSALFDAAVESAALPVRMQAQKGRRVPTLSDWEGIINDDGRRRVAGLSLSIATEAPQNGAKGPKANAADTRMRGGDEGYDEEDGERLAAANALLDIDLFPAQVPGVRVSLSSPASSRRTKTFARIDTSRGLASDSTTAAADDDDDDDGHGFRRRGLPAVERYVVSSPALPLLPTFPHIFPSAPAPSRISTPTVAVRTSLRASSGIASWIRGMETAVGGMAAGVLAEELGGEEKEALRNGLAEVAEEYVEGWESGGSEGEEE